MAGQFTPQGYIPSQSDPGTADLSATANSILALASANTGASTAAAGLSYMESNVDAYVSQDGADGPGQLALLILDAHALGVDPTSFGGTNLVTRLMATEEMSGSNDGLFGTKSQVRDFQAGVFDQGLALAALAATGDTKGSAIKSAESWLLHQQCADGGWTSYESKNNPCNGSPADFEGPDTNSTALAIEGLAAEGDLSGAADSNAHSFLVHAQDSDGGWGYEPNTTKTPGSTDPDSTALVIQAILALGDSPTKAPFTTNANPVAVLESFQADFGRQRRVVQLPRCQWSEPSLHLPGSPGGGRSRLPIQSLRDDIFPAGGNAWSALQGQAPRNGWQCSVHVVRGERFRNTARRPQPEQLDRRDQGKANTYRDVDLRRRSYRHQDGDPAPARQRGLGHPFDHDVVADGRRFVHGQMRTDAAACSARNSRQRERAVLEHTLVPPSTHVETAQPFGSRDHCGVHFPGHPWSWPESQ